MNSSCWPVCEHFCTLASIQNVINYWVTFALMTIYRSSISTAQLTFGLRRNSWYPRNVYSPSNIILLNLQTATWDKVPERPDIVLSSDSRSHKCPRNARTWWCSVYDKILEEEKPGFWWEPGQWSEMLRCQSISNRCYCATVYCAKSTTVTRSCYRTVIHYCTGIIMTLVLSALLQLV